MGFVTGIKLAQALATLRMSNKMVGTMYDSWRGLGGQRSSLRPRPQQYRGTSQGEQECYRRRVGGFYKERKHDVFK